MESEYLSRLIAIVEGLNPKCLEIGPGTMAQMKQLAEDVKTELNARSKTQQKKSGVTMAQPN
jgi:hypothetical protein